ncbi:MAG: DUF6242 domain-containing protein [Porphyromonas sp.]|nr:DUF6242 domain-containing protein [Porphyromonas sp.]
MKNSSQKVWGKMSSMMLLVLLVLVGSACNRKDEQRVSPYYVGQNTPAFAYMEFDPKLKLDRVTFHIDNRKMRIWNSQYLPFGTEVDSAYLNMGISNQLGVTILNETTGKRVENWDSAKGDQLIEIKGGKLKVIVEKGDAPTLSYDLRLMGYGYDPNKLTWARQEQRLPVKSDRARVLELDEEKYWLTRLGSDASALYRITSLSPILFDEVAEANIPSKLAPESLLRDHIGDVWAVTDEGLLYKSSDLRVWEMVELGSIRLTLLISDRTTDDNATLLTAVGYDTAEPETFFTYTIESGVVEKGVQLDAGFPVREAYIYTYQVAGKTHSNIFSGLTADGTPAVSSFFTSDGINWGEAPYSNNALAETLPVRGGLFLNPFNNKDIYVVGGIYNGGEPSNRICKSDDRGNAWKELSKEQAPGETFRPRHGASGLIGSYVGGMPQFYIFGGNIGGESSDEIWLGWLDTTGGILNDFD